MQEKKGKVVLISPNLLGTRDGINRIQPALGIGYLGASLIEQGHEVFLRDTALEGYENQQILADGKTVLIGETDEQIADYIRSIQPDLVGISILFSSLSDSARRIARIVKSVNPHIYVVIGGNHVTNAYRDYLYKQEHIDANPVFEKAFLTDLQETAVDFALIGEGERTFSQLVECIVNHKDLGVVENLVWLDRAAQPEVVRATTNPFLASAERVDLLTLPPMPWEKFDMEKYFAIGAFHSPRTNAKRILPIMTTRGCPEKCRYCTTAETWGNKVRLRGAANVIREIKNGIALCGEIDEIQFLDDTITADLKNLYALCDELEKLGIRWCTPNGTKANYHMAQQLDYYKRMKAAGCYQITIACETGNQNVMDTLLNKRLKLHEMATAIHNAKEAGLYIHTFWIVGFPGESREEMEETIAYAASLGADSYSVAILLPLPGTPIFRQVVENNLYWSDLNVFERRNYGSSVIQVDGFSGPVEFEDWVNKQNRMLNQLLEKRDPQRARDYATFREPALSGKFMHQT